DGGDRATRRYAYLTFQFHRAPRFFLTTLSNSKERRSLQNNVILAVLKRTPLLIFKNYNVDFIIVKRFFEKEQKGEDYELTAFFCDNAIADSFFKGLFFYNRALCLLIQKTAVGILSVRVNVFFVKKSTAQV
ncbi:MAG: hypothetical protein J6X44_08820, partial [Thermoguttaceae bacterium]|nr:hypothetical protein [Thermoguttaceae bacterium]